MNRSISTLLTTLLCSAALLPTASYAQTAGTAQTSLNPYVASQPAPNQLNPFNLTFLAYQGYLKDQGIPSNGAFINAIASGKVTAQDLMQAAVKANRLPEQTLTNPGYRSALEAQMNGLTED
jgi:hypothetical protein